MQVTIKKMKKLGLSKLYDDNEYFKLAVKKINHVSFTKTGADFGRFRMDKRILDSHLSDSGLSKRKRGEAITWTKKRKWLLHDQAIKRQTQKLLSNRITVPEFFTSTANLYKPNVIEIVIEIVKMAVMNARHNVAYDVESLEGGFSFLLGSLV